MRRKKIEKVPLRKKLTTFYNVFLLRVDINIAPRFVCSSGSSGSIVAQHQRWCGGAAGVRWRQRGCHGLHGYVVSERHRCTETPFRLTLQHPRVDSLCSRVLPLSLSPAISLSLTPFLSRSLSCSYPSLTSFPRRPTTFFPPNHLSLRSPACVRIPYRVDYIVPKNRSLCIIYRYMRTCTRSCVSKGVHCVRVRVQAKLMKNTTRTSTALI